MQLGARPESSAAVTGRYIAAAHAHRWQGRARVVLRALSEPPTPCPVFKAFTQVPASLFARGARLDLFATPPAKFISARQIPTASLDPLCARSATVAVTAHQKSTHPFLALWAVTALLVTRRQYRVLAATIARQNRLVFRRNAHVELTAQRHRRPQRTAAPVTTALMHLSPKSRVHQEQCARQTAQAPAYIRPVLADTTVQARPLHQHCAMLDNSAIKDHLQQVTVQPAITARLRAFVAPPFVNAGTIVQLDHQHRFHARQESIVRLTQPLHWIALLAKAAKSLKRVHRPIVHVDTSALEVLDNLRNVQLGLTALGVHSRPYPQIVRRDRSVQHLKHALLCLVIALTTVPFKA